MQNVLLLRFDELETAIRPADEIGNLDDLIVEAGLTMPTVVDAAVGRGRRFVAATGHGVRALDKVSGSTLLSRHCSIQAIVNWQLAAQSAYGSPGTIYARGKGTAVAEYMGAGLELRVVNAALSVGELRWIWHDSAGVLKTQIGAHFVPHASEFLMLTATRRWVSSGEVVLRYYLGDMLIGEVTSVDGDIGGGTTGTTSIGTRYTGAAWGRFLDGTIDELRVVDYELAEEEIKATWDRITLHQPRGYQLLKELHDPGFPMSADPGSKAQRETRIWGNALGYAAAQAENLRNLIPSRAYGEPLEEWEDVTKQAPKPGDSTDTRQARVVARLRRTEGVSIPGVKAALKDLAGTVPENLEVLAFDQTITETWETIRTARWQAEPAADFTISGNALRVQAIAGNFTYEGANWKRIAMSIGGNGRAARILSKITPTTLPANAEVGVYLENAGSRNISLLGLRFEGGVHKIMHEEFRAGVSQGAVQLANLGAGMPANVWLHLWSKASIAYGDPPDLDLFRAAYSVTSGTAGFVESGDLTHKGIHHWAGLYMRGNVAGAVDAKFDDTIVRAPCGDRSFFLFVYRNPALAGKLDSVGANHVIRQLKQAHTHAAVITTKSLLYDDESSGHDAGPMGGL